jgi:hypothetical protein
MQLTAAAGVADAAAANAGARPPHAAGKGQTSPFSVLDSLTVRLWYSDMQEHGDRHQLPD